MSNSQNAEVVADAVLCWLAVRHCQWGSRQQAVQTSPSLADAGCQSSTAVAAETAQRGSTAASHSVISVTPLPSRSVHAPTQTMSSSASLTTLPSGSRLYHWMWINDEQTWISNKQMCKNTIDYEQIMQAIAHVHFICVQTTHFHLSWHTNYSHFPFLAEIVETCRKNNWCTYGSCKDSVTTK